MLQVYRKTNYNYRITIYLAKGKPNLLKIVGSLNFDFVPIFKFLRKRVFTSL